MDINEPNHHQSPKNAILTQNTNKTETKLQRLSARKFKLRWILAISCLPLFGIYTAFGIAPQTSTSNITTSMVVEEVSLPSVEKASNDEANLEKFWYKDYVRRDDTLQSILTRLNVRNRDALDFIRNDSIASAVARAIIPGRQVKTETDADGNLFHFEYQINTDSFLTITKTDAGYIAKQDNRTFEVHPILKSAKISSSLFGATDAANIPDSIAIQIADIFESEINFHTDLRRGDHFNVIYEGNYDQGELIKVGDVLAAEFVNDGKTYRAVGFRDSNNQMQYYTPEGKGIHKSFLRSPLEFSRVSSGFSVARYHPVLQRMRAHKGVDLAAPTGTRIKASADAMVDFVGQKGGYGNVIVLKHANGVSTVYGHLSRFAPDLRRGLKVTQGQMIGFVGMSGMATGPHLHYEFLINGQHQDPMKVALPKANAINDGNKAEFESTSKQLTAELRLLGTSNIAALE